MPVRILFDVSEPETHLVRVVQTFPAVPGTPRTFRMPAWVPGSYKIRDFGRHVQDLEARVDGRPARVEQSGKDAWRVSGADGKEVELEYRVYCRELTVDTSHVTTDHAHLFPATLAMYDEASRGLPHKVDITAPAGWRLWSGLETEALDGHLEAAADYDHLIDCPIEAGPPEDYLEERFTLRNRVHRIVVWKPPEHVDWPRVRRDVRAIVDETARVFGGLPYRHYTFLSHVAHEHGGGLEHRNSTVLGVDPLHLQSPEKIQTRFLPLVAHEFFHTWNVKRILPEAFLPYRLQEETYTDLLWLFEGFTSYYELPLLARAGVVDAKHWGKVVAEMLEYYETALGRRRRSVAEASRLTWTLLYQPHEHNVNRNVSYYTKGLFVGLCLDHHLRSEGVRDGLDAVMRHLWNHYAQQERGVPEDAFARIVQEATGVDAAARIGAWVNGTTELPVDRALRALGWDVKREHKDPDKRLGLGVHLKKDGRTVERIHEDRPAFRRLDPGDELVAVEGYKWSQERFAESVRDRKEGMEVQIAVFREGRLRSVPVPLTELPKDKITIEPRKGDAAATRLRRAWLGRRIEQDA